MGVLFFFTSFGVGQRKKRYIVFFSLPAEGIVSCIIRSLNGGVDWWWVAIVVVVFVVLDGFFYTLVALLTGSFVLG